MSAPTLPTLPPPPVSPEPAGGPRGSRSEPARRLVPDPGRDRPWRVLSVLGGTLVTLLVLALLAAGTIVPWAMDRGIGQTAARQSLGTPSSLTITSATSDVTVVPSDAVTELELALVPAGTTALPAEGSEVRAEVTVSGPADRPSVAVRQPVSGNPIPWASPESLSVLVLVPADLAPALTLDADVGDLEVTGTYERLDVHADTGDVRLPGVSTTGPLAVTADVGDVTLDVLAPGTGGTTLDLGVGDVEVSLAEGARGDLDVDVEVADVLVRAPGDARWSVAATTTSGTTQVDPGLEAADGDGTGAITVSVEVGDVTITR